MGACSPNDPGFRRAGDEVQPGWVIADRYRLERPIGTGGMATIWEATHLSLNRSIALKFVAIAGTSPAKIRARFLREARVAAAVRHRNVVDILDFGTADDGQPFMAMELLVGSTLSDRMDRRGGLDIAEAVRILAQVLSGLAAVHDAGIVHRDLKPENVFLAEDADGMIPKLLDFGVSRALDETSGLKSVLPTLENVIVGTPQYMSPEQARGLTEIDQRADLWSAGVMLFELLTGELPFDGEAVGDVIVQVATKNPPDLADLRPDLAGPLADVVRRAMQRRPEDRYQSAREMRADLLRAVADTAQALRSLPTIERAKAHSTAAALLGAVDEAYEPGDSGVLDVVRVEAHAVRLSVPLVEKPTLPAPPTIAPPTIARPAKRRPKAVPALVALAAGGLALLVYTMRDRAPEAAPARASVAEPEVVTAPPVVQATASVAEAHLEPAPIEEIEPGVIEEIEEAAESALRPMPSRRPAAAGFSAPPRARRAPRADGLLEDPGF